MGINAEAQANDLEVSKILGAKNDRTPQEEALYKKVLERLAHPNWFYSDYSGGGGLGY